MDIIERNFFSLIRSGGLNEFVALEPMSPYKWRRLMAMAIDRHVEDTVTKGLRSHQYDMGIEIPRELFNVNTSPTPSAQATARPPLANRLLNHRLETIRRDELHAIDTSVDTLELLDIIIACITTMLNSDVSIRQLLRLGVFLRTRGNRADFVKLDQWLTRLHLQRIAQLQGCILMTGFGFEQDELPFVHRVEPAASQLLNRSLHHGDREYEEWQVSDNKPIFVKTNSRALFRNLRRCMRYLAYAPLEAISNLLGNMARSISEIEE